MKVNMKDYSFKLKILNCCPLIMTRFSFDDSDSDSDDIEDVYESAEDSDKDIVLEDDDIFYTCLSV